MNIKTMLTAVAMSSVVVLSSAAIAQAAPGDNDKGYGGCIDNFYGNATNARPGGHGVLPSQSPGPWVNNPTDPDNPTWGFSVGAVMQVLIGELEFTGAEAQAIICTFP